MRLYETAFLIAPNLPEEETEQFIAEMAEVVSSRKGKMVNIDKWGKRKLAYPIQKFEAAFYVFFLYEGGPDIPGELERRFKQMETVIRYLTVKKDLRDNVRRKRGFPRRKEPEMAREPAPRAGVKKAEGPMESAIPPAVKEKEPTDIIELEKEETKKETKPKEEDKKEVTITEEEKPKKEEEKAKEDLIEEPKAKEKPKKEEKTKEKETTKEKEKAKEEKKPQEEEKDKDEEKGKKEVKPKKEEKIKEKETAKEEKVASEKIKETEKKKEKDKEEKS